MFLWFNFALDFSLALFVGKLCCFFFLLFCFAHFFFPRILLYDNLKWDTWAPFFLLSKCFLPFVSFSFVGKTYLIIDITPLFVSPFLFGCASSCSTPTVNLRREKEAEEKGTPKRELKTKENELTIFFLPREKIITKILYNILID